LWLHASLRGKFVAWGDQLAGLHLRGDERILDLGCGRGAVLLLAAGHLTTGRAVGVDIWRKADQSGNSPAAAARNAAAEGVSDRVALVTADMRSLPFDEAGFDVVVSSLALHNIRDLDGRRQALAEAVRVLKAGGRLLIVDIWGTSRYPSELADLGMTGIGRHGLGWRLWWGGPWAPTFLVSATKPMPAQGQGA
jgi:ubiquinone/menaquinone biosynthesis C-methylase UbiE